jgi:SAM-dependent methyltransferase
MSAADGDGRRDRTWICPLASLALAAGVLLLFGWSVWTALAAVVLMACPVAWLWAAIAGRGPLPVPVGPVPQTRGLTMDWAAPVYDVMCRSMGLGPAFRERTLAVADLRAGERLLDAGCGTGVLTRLAADRVGAGGRAIGVDPGPDMIRVARANAAAARNAAEFRPGALEALPFEAASFDVVAISFVLHHLPEDLRPAGLAEARRVLKPGGRLVMVDLDWPALPLWWLAVWPPWLTRARGLLRGDAPDLLRRAGFVPVERVGRRAGLISLWKAVKPADATDR